MESIEISRDNYCRNGRVASASLVYRANGGFNE